MARIEASASHADDMLRRGIDIRYVVTSLQGSDAEHIYETIYCARGFLPNARRRGLEGTGKTD